MSSSGSRSLPDRAEIVIIGGGIIGASVAYHLTKLGRTDVVLLEQGQLSGGTTWHAAGLLGQLRATESGTRLVQYSASLYESLEEETGLATGFKRCGGVTVARTPDRLLQLERTAATAEAYDLECELLSPAQARDRYPILEIDDLLGALWLPGDGTANPVDVTASLARGARMGGAAIFERTRVIDVLVKDEAEGVAIAKKYIAYFQGTTTGWTCADPEKLREAPVTMPVRRLDEAEAARRPVLRQRFPEDEEAGAC